MENLIQNDKKKRSKRPFFYTIFGLVAIMIVGFIVGTKLDSTDYQNRLLIDKSPSVSLSASVDDTTFVEDKLELDSPGIVALQWSINPGNMLIEDPGTKSSESFVPVGGTDPDFIVGKIQAQLDGSSTWQTLGFLTALTGSTNVNVKNDATYMAVFEYKNTSFAQNAVSVIINGETSIIDTGYEINGNQEQVTVEKNTNMTHSWEIKPLSAHAEIEAYLEKMGYEVSDFLKIEKLNDSGNVTNPSWEEVYAPETLIGEYLDKAPEEQSTYRFSIVMPHELQGTDEALKLQKLGLLPYAEVIEVYVTEAAKQSIDIKVNGEDGPIDGSNYKSMNLSWTSEGLEDTLYLAKGNISDSPDTYEFIDNVKTEGNLQVSPTESTIYHLFNRDPSLEIDTPLVSDSVTVLMNNEVVIDTKASKIDVTPEKVPIAPDPKIDDDKFYSTITATVVDSNKQPLAGKDVTLFSIFVRDPQLKIMIPAPCSDFPCYNSLYLQEDSSTLKTDASGVVKWHLLSTEVATTQLYAVVDKQEIDNDGNAPTVTFVNSAGIVDTKLSTINTEPTKVPVAPGIVKAGKAYSTITATVVDSNKQPLAGKDVTLFSIFVPKPYTRRMIPAPCSDFPCYNSLYLQGSSTLKTDASGVATWHLLSTKVATTQVYAVVDKQEINNDGDAPIIYFYEDVPDVLTFNLELDGRDQDPETDTADYAYPLKLSVIKDSTILDTFTVWSADDGKFPDPADPETALMNKRLAELTGGDYTFRLFSNAHIPINVVGTFNPSNNYMLNLKLLAGNIAQNDRSDNKQTTNVDIINVNDVLGFFPLWGQEAPISFPYDPMLAENEAFIADINHNGMIGAEDFSVILSNMLKEESTIDLEDAKITDIDAPTNDPILIDPNSQALN